MRRAWITCGATLGWFALLLQFYLTMGSSLAAGRSVPGAVIFYFSFFTILTNFLIAAQLSSLLWLPQTRLGRWFSRATVQAASATYIVIVAGTYSLLLRNVWDPQGLQKLADVLLHDVVPLVYVGYWLFFATKHGLRRSDALRWMVYPLAYLAYSLARGGITGEYPYPFLNASALGYERTLINAAMLTGAFLVVAWGVIFLGRWLRGRPVDRRSSIESR